MPLLEQVLERYPKKVKVVFKQFPLNNHRYARLAATASLAAHQQGKFWPFHDLLFQNYQQLSEQFIRDVAAKVGLDPVRFEKSLNDPALNEQVNAEVQQGAQAGVRGTPTILVNGKLLKTRSLEGFSELIDRDLKKAGLLK